MADAKDFENRILRRVAITLWIMIFMTVIVAYLLKGVYGGDIRAAVYAATSIMTQVYVLNPEYSTVIFLFAIVGKVLLFYIIYVLILLFGEGVFRKSMEEGRLARMIKSLKDHYIICGAGRVGGNVAQELLQSKKKFVLIDKNAEALERFKHLNVAVVVGDSLDEDVLKLAGIDRAKAVISCLDSDGNNILQIISAKKLNPKVKIVSRASQEKFVPNLRNVGADQIIIPEFIGGKVMAEAATKL